MNGTGNRRSFPVQLRRGARKVWLLQAAQPIQEGIDRGRGINRIGIVHGIGVGAVPVAIAVPIAIAVAVPVRVAVVIVVAAGRTAAHSTTHAARAGMTAPGTALGMAVA